jgi:hypothetical protein
VTDDDAAEIARLRGLGRQQLKERWRDLYKASPPVAFTPDLLARGIAWRLQEKNLGGLTSEARHLLEGNVHGKAAKARLTLRPGNRLVRRWRGRTYVVEVNEQDFSYDDARFRSLSEIARAITGTRWSGPKFFGLVR